MKKNPFIGFYAEHSPSTCLRVVRG